ncbi:phosphoglucomutase/phosphomannomutase family protein [Deferrisoma palaeochoriense]
MKIRFGTDGWRGVIARDFTFENVRRVAAAVASYLEAEGLAGRGVAVGFDRRFLSGAFAEEAAGVLAARGIRVWVAPTPVPTPVVSWAVRHRGLGGGLMITASHNPPEWNGVKFKEHLGCAARSATSAKIEAALARIEGPVDCIGPAEARRRGLWEPLEVWDAYREAVWGFVDREAIRRAGLTVVLDAMHGCAHPWLPMLLEEAGCEVEVLRAEENPGFGGVAPEPLEDRLGDLAGRVRERGGALGLANDGDADRIGAVDERGRYFSTQRIFALILHHLLEERGLRGRVVRSASGTVMADLLARRRGLPVLETPIGFKFIGEALLEPGTLIGGEESGGIGIPAFGPERDGLLNALLLAEIVARRGRGLRACLEDVFAETGYFAYDRVDLPLAPERAGAVREALARWPDPPELAGRAVVRVSRTDGLRFERDDDSWLLVRPSGTEPKLRLYAEARGRDEVAALLEAGRHLVDDLPGAA